MQNRDPKGYYAILQVPPTASAADIAAAYKRRAMVLHPDRNATPTATRDFQLLTEAYGVLKNPTERAQYDTSEVEAKTGTVETKAAPPEPIVCSACGKVTAQPRYVIFYEVKSFIFLTTRKPIQGIFCSACAEKKVFRATAITWVLGWWGFPWGFIYTPHAIIKNLFGGERPRKVNAKLAAYQASVFATLGRVDIARAIAVDAMSLAKRIKPENMSGRLRKAFGHEVDDEGSRLRHSIEQLATSLGSGGKPVRLKNTWSLLRRPFFVQLSMAAAAFILVSVAVQNSHGDISQSQPRSYAATPEPELPQKPSYVRPATAPNGNAWPTYAAYLSGYPHLRTNGISTVTIDNGQDSSDVFVKLFSLDGQEAHPVRTFFIPAHGRFTVGKVSPGNYDIRYRDLGTGYIFRTDSFSLTQTSTSRGIRYSDITMTLYKVLNGNMRTHRIPASDF